MADDAVSGLDVVAAHRLRARMRTGRFGLRPGSLRIDIVGKVLGASQKPEVVLMPHIPVTSQ